MLRTIALMMVSVTVLTACGDGVERAQRKAIQDRELQLPIDACIGHTIGETDVAAELLKAGYQPIESNRYRREFSDLDSALSAQGAIDVILEEECTLFIPIHVAVLDELDRRIAARLSAVGYKPVTAPSGGALGADLTIYKNEQSSVSYSGFARSYALLGFASTIRFTKR